jgi:hypothetical protein
VALTPGDDEFTGSFAANVIGDYRIRVRATGTAGRGHPFTRERTAWAGVWRGGDTPPPGGPGDFGGALAEHDRRWCAVLRCVLLTLSGNDRLMKWWSELGLDPREFLKCVESLCTDTAPGRTGPVPDDVRRLVAELRRTVGDAG